MAICFVQAKVIGRSGGQSAVAAAAYRSGLKLTDDRTGDIHDYRKKQGVDYSTILTPIDAIGANDWLTDRAKLWNKVEESEKRYDAQLSREMIIAIPIELDRETMIKLVCDHVQSSYVDRGMIADINLHHLDGNNPHAHVMLTMRELTIDDKGAVSFGAKNRSWNDKKLVQKQKQEWEVLANQYLDRAGIESRIDSRSYKEQGINKIPQIHVGAAASRLEKRGIKTKRGDHNREVAIANQAIANTQADINQANQKLEELAAEFAREGERRAAKSLPTLRKGFDPGDIERQLAEFDRQVIPVSDQEQKLKDRDVFASARSNPAIRQTQEYQDARDRKNSRFYPKTEKPKEIKPTPEAAVKRITLYQKTDPQLIRSIIETGNRLGADCYHAGDYHVQISAKQIDVRHHNNLAVIISMSTDLSMLIDRSQSITLNQYEQDLQRSIDVLITDLEQPEPQPEPDIIIDDSALILESSMIEDSESIIIDDPKIELKTPITKPRRQIDQGCYPN